MIHDSFSPEVISLTRPDNYALQADFARRLFLERDQAAILAKSPVTADEANIHLTLLSQPYRVCRATGRIFRLEGDWVPADSHGEVLTIFDWLCDARPHRCLSGIWKTTTSLGIGIHSGLLDHSAAALAKAIDGDPGSFVRACEALNGAPVSQCDLGFTVPFFPDLPVSIRFWHSDEEFPPQLTFLWDANTLLYLRYETTFYALGLLRRRLSRLMDPSFEEN